MRFLSQPYVHLGIFYELTDTDFQYDYMSGSPNLTTGIFIHVINDHVYYDFPACKYQFSNMFI